jgi:hypothetical protein
MAAQEAHTDALLRIQGVVGTAVGLADGGPVVKIFTEHAGVVGLPRTLDGVTVEVQVTGKIFALHHCKGKHAEDPSCSSTPTDPPEVPGTDCSAPDAWCPRPVPIGVSTGHPDITAGTIGARLIDVKVPENPDDDVFYVLSNNHVYANSNEGSKGVDKVLQPGPFDGGTDPTDAIGTLSDFEVIKFDGSDNTIDAAIAKIAFQDFNEDDVAELAVGNATPSDGYGMPNSTPVAASVNQKVMKYGRTTGQTTGTITGIEATLNVCYEAAGPFCTKVAKFVGQMVIEGTRRNPFSQGGDSGSLIVSNKREPIGLVFAGSSFLGRDFTYANPIVPILDRFGVTIDGK